MIRALVGTNSYAINQYANKLKDEFKSSYGDMSVEELDSEDLTYSVLINAINASDLFADKKLVIVKNLSENKQAAAEIDKLIKNASEDSNLLLIEHNPDKRSAYYKNLKKLEGFNEFNELSEYELADWVKIAIEDQKGSISRADSEYLVQRAGMDQMNLANELKKLLDYNKNITKESIDLLIDESPSSSVFNLLDSAFSGETGRILSLYKDQRDQGNEPQAIFAMVVWQVHQLCLVASCRDKSQGEIADTTGLKPFSISKASGILSKISSRGLVKILDKMMRADRQLKTKPVDPDELVKNLLVSLAT